MTNDLRHPDEIEHDIREERARMSETIDDLQRKFSVDAIVGDIGTMFRTQGGDLTRAVSETVGRNPAAVVMVGVGLAWLFLGQARAGAAATQDSSWGPSSKQGRSWPTQAERRNTNSMKGRPTGGMSVERDEYWYRSDNDQSSRHQQRANVDGDQTSYGETSFGAADPSTHIVGTVHETAGAVGDAVSGAASSLGQASTGLTDRLAHGLEGLSDEARSRVLAARYAAEDARRRAADAMRTGSRAAASFFEDQPLVVGALAVALGAAVGSALPHSRIEDETLGASSDRLFAEAQAIYREERDKARAALRATAMDVQGEIKDIASELTERLPDGKSVGDVIVDRASDATKRVVDHAMGAEGRSGTDQAAG